MRIILFKFENNFSRLMATENLQALKLFECNGYIHRKRDCLHSILANELGMTPSLLPYPVNGKL